MDQPNFEDSKPTVKGRRILSAITSPFRKVRKFFRISIFRARYYLKYRIRLKEFVIIEPRIFLSLLGITIIGYLLLSPRPWELRFPSRDNEVYLAENILRTISIFVGIVFSFIVLSFNVFYKYFGRFTFIQFFSNVYVKFIFTFFVCTIVLVLYTCAILKESEVRTVYGDFLFCCSVVVSLLLVLSIIPVLILLLRSSQNRDNISLLISNFNKEWTESEFLNQVFNRKNGKNSQEDRDPINLIIEIGTAAIKDFDRQSIIAIKNGCLKHFNIILNEYKVAEGISPLDFYERQIDLGRILFQVAIKERNENAAIIIIKMLLEVESIYIEHFEHFNPYEHENHTYDGIPFSVAMKETFVKAVQFNEDTVAQRIIDTCRSWLELIIKVYLPKIKYDFPKEKGISLDKQSYLIMSTYSSLGQIFKSALSYKKTLIYKEISSLFNVVDLNIIDSNNTRNTKVFLLQQNGSHSLTEFKNFIKQLDSEISFDNYPFGIATSHEISEVKSQVPLQYELKAFEWLFFQNKLNVFVINSLKAVALHAISMFEKDNKGAISVLLSIIRKFNEVKNYIRSEDTDHRKEIYILLYKYLEIIKDYAATKGIKDKNLIDEWDSVLKTFPMRDDFQKQLDSKGYIVKDHLDE
ncbi:hypothetical protein [Pedobacter alluvionis]|uniref:DUF2254 domain-containing protein n=1 Tax=Pedobacter alluvionis TaxID=475253 RepID=A0A497XY38_9SPHI|nr:hypothetical protein [Pedobacter alluvionis]RLJ73647.1 hypothetical protein BCL90_3809 [Pedobacter alluvionis]TFB32728.1 hypothetical protein E3V97_01430 [Pedobacter alluvionis]